MKQIKVAILVLLLMTMTAACQKKNPVVEIQTPKGKLIVELDMENAPITAGNFLKLVKEGVYDGASFYRTVRNAPNQKASSARRQTRFPAFEKLQNQPNQQPSGYLSPVCLKQK